MYLIGFSSRVWYKRHCPVLLPINSLITALRGLNKIPYFFAAKKLAIDFMPLVEVFAKALLLLVLAPLAEEPPPDASPVLAFLGTPKARACISSASDRVFHFAAAAEDEDAPVVEEKSAGVIKVRTSVIWVSISGKDASPSGAIFQMLGTKETTNRSSSYLMFQGFALRQKHPPPFVPSGIMAHRTAVVGRAVHHSITTWVCKGPLR